MDLCAKIYYLTNKESGRIHPVNSGYRGQFYYDGYDWDAHQEFVGKDTCKLGESVEVNLTMLSSVFHFGKFFIGKKFEIREGARITGRGEITKIYNDIFKKWNFNFIKNQISQLKKYNSIDLEGYIEDIHYYFSQLKEVKKIKILKNIDDKEKMIIIDCQLKDKYQSSRPFIDEVCELWEKSLALEKSKIKLERVSNKIGFELIFATWNESFLSGKITFKNSVYKEYK